MKVQTIVSGGHFYHVEPPGRDQRELVEDDLRAEPWRRGRLLATVKPLARLTGADPDEFAGMGVGRVSLVWDRHLVSEVDPNPLPELWVELDSEYHGLRGTLRLYLGIGRQDLSHALADIAALIEAGSDALDEAGREYDKRAALSGGDEPQPAAD